MNGYHVPVVTCLSVCPIRLERLDHLAQKFRHKCEIHEEWSERKDEMLRSDDFKHCRLNEVKVCRRHSSDHIIGYLAGCFPVQRSLHRTFVAFNLLLLLVLVVVVVEQATA